MAIYDKTELLKQTAVRQEVISYDNFCPCIAYELYNLPFHLKVQNDGKSYILHKILYCVTKLNTIRMYQGMRRQTLENLAPQYLLIQFCFSNSNQPSSCGG